MKKSYLAIIGYDAPTPDHSRAVRQYGHLYVIATSEKEALAFVAKHLDERKPLGFSEREIRKKNPKRTPWRPGLRVIDIMGWHEVGDDREVGVVFDDD